MSKASAERHYDLDPETLMLFVKEAAMQLSYLSATLLRRRTNSTPR